MSDPSLSQGLWTISVCGERNSLQSSSSSTESELKTLPGPRSWKPSRKVGLTSRGALRLSAVHLFISAFFFSFFFVSTQVAQIRRPLFAQTSWRTPEISLTPPGRSFHGHLGFYNANLIKVKIPIHINMEFIKGTGFFFPRNNLTATHKIK